MWPGQTRKNGGGKEKGTFYFSIVRLFCEALERKSRMSPFPGLALLHQNVHFGGGGEGLAADLAEGDQLDEASLLWLFEANGFECGDVGPTSGGDG